MCNKYYMGLDVPKEETIAKVVSELNPQTEHHMPLLLELIDVMYEIQCCPVT